MYLDAKMPEGRNVFVVDSRTGERLKTVFALDTDAKWLDRYATDENGRVKLTPPGPLTTVPKEFVKERLFIDYDLVNKTTGEVIAEVRQ